MVDKNLPLLLHDVVFIEAPKPMAVSRVTLRPWCHLPHPDTPFTGVTAPLAVCMQEAYSWVSAEAPEYAHGLLIHAIQYERDAPPSPPSTSTLKQYTTRLTVLGNVPLTSSPYVLDVPEHLVLISLETRHKRPKWMWHHLAGMLLLKTQTKTAGENPPPLRT